MRNPERARNLALAFTATGVVAVIALWQLPADTGRDAQAALVCYAFTALIFGGASAFFRHREWAAQQLLERGTDVLAQWRVDADTWRDFIVYDRQLMQEPDARPNELDGAAHITDAGIQIIAGKEAIKIGASVHMVPVRGTPEIQQAALNDSRVRPSYVELQLKYPPGPTGASGVVRGPTYSVLRFPVPPTALSAARTLVAHYNGDVAATPDFFHGTGDGKDAEDLSVCWNCGFETYKLRSECPRCGSSLQSRRWSRRFGAIIAVGGSGITVAMLWVLIKVGPLLRHPGESINGTRFSGSASAAAGVLAILLVVFSLGAGMAGYGAYQVATGKRNRKAVYIMVGVTLALATLAEFL